MIDMLKALAEENRLLIVRELSRGPMCVREIEERLGMAQNLVSHHLAVLKDIGIVENCRCGKNQYYSLNRVSIRHLIRGLGKL